MTAVDTLEYMAPGRPRQATLREIPRLAWMLSLACTDRFGWLIAPFVYISNLEGLRQRASIGGVWHSDGLMLLLAMPVGGPKRSKVSQPWWAFIALMGFLLIGLVSQAIGGTLLMGAIVVLVLMSVPTLFMLPKLLSPSTRRANAAIKDWSRSAPSQAYVLSCLVKDRRVEWGAGVPFVEDVFKAGKFPSGTPVAVMAGNDKHGRFLKALGFRPLERNGEPTRAMVRRT